MLNKNDYCEIEIVDVGQTGEGIGKYEDFVLFVEGALPEDVCYVKIIKLKKSYGYAKLIKILKPSRHRTEPFCDVFKKCGGCNLMHMCYDAQLIYKHKKVADSLERIGGIINPFVNAVVPMDNLAGYRNKAQVPVRNENGEIKIGYYAKNSHKVIECKDCYIQNEKVGMILALIEKYMVDYNISAYDENKNTGIVRHILVKMGFGTGEIMVCLVINKQQGYLPDNIAEVTKSLSEIEGMTSICLNYNREKTNVILGKNCVTLWGGDFITDILGGLRFKISPLSFYQVNPVQAEKMYQCVLDYACISNEDVVIDAYCGIGTISLFLAKYAKKVYGIEIIEDAVRDAVLNAKENGVTNAEFIIGKSEKVIYDLMESGVRISVIVVDPPRKGCDEALVHAISQIMPVKIVYVSCNPDTLARDVKMLVEAGYILKRVQPFDMFAFSTHVETIALLQKKDCL